jgi:predicted amidohydrolase YtcJ
MQHSASIAVVNADVRTMNREVPRAQAVLVRNGVIDAVGTDSEIHGLAAADDILIIDAGGNTVLPGFIDAHTHMELACYSLEYWPQAHTPPLESLEEVAQSIRDFLNRNPGDDFLLVRSSFGMHAKVSENRLFTRKELDEITADRPLAVAAGLHVISLNTPAMELLGVFELPDSLERVIHRDENGEPSGVVTEILEQMPEFAKEKLGRAIIAHLPALATHNGVTTIGSIAWNTYDRDVFEQLITDGMPIRLKSYPHVPRVMSVDTALSTALDSRAAVSHSGLGGYKIFVDGQHGDGLDAVFDDLKWSQKDLNEFVAGATNQGSQVIMHAVSTTAIRMALEAIERSSNEPGNPLRHRIEHGGDYIEAIDIERAASSGALLVTTPQFILSADGESAGPGALLKSILGAGIRLVAGTDTTGTVPEGAAPLYNIACAMNRSGKSASEALTFEEAASLFTTSAAYSMFEERTRGDIAPGKFGDLVILDRAVDEVADPRDFFEVSVKATIFAGDVVYTAGGK